MARGSFPDGSMAPVKTGAISLLGSRPAIRGVSAGRPNLLFRKEPYMSEERDRERCGEAIPARRLEALPNTRLCIECSQAIGGDYVTYVIPEHTQRQRRVRPKEQQRDV